MHKSPSPAQGRKHLIRYILAGAALAAACLLLACGPSLEDFKADLGAAVESARAGRTDEAREAFARILAGAGALEFVQRCELIDEVTDSVRRLWEDKAPGAGELLPFVVLRGMALQRDPVFSRAFARDSGVDVRELILFAAEHASGDDDVDFAVLFDLFPDTKLTQAEAQRFKAIVAATVAGFEKRRGIVERLSDYQARSMYDRSKRDLGDEDRLGGAVFISGGNLDWSVNRKFKKLPVTRGDVSMVSDLDAADVLVYVRKGSIDHKYDSAAFTSGAGITVHQPVYTVSFIDTRTLRLVYSHKVREAAPPPSVTRNNSRLNYDEHATTELFEYLKGIL